MRPETFKAAMVALYGYAWVTPAAAEFNIRPNKLQRMAAGTERIYPDTGERIRGCLENKSKEIAMLLQDIRLEREAAVIVAAVNPPPTSDHPATCDCDFCILF
jgi:hypothetical protein